MAKNFTHLWPNDTWRETEKTLGQRPLLYTGTNHFRRRGGSEGDRVYVISIRDENIYLLARMTVIEILDRSEAKEDPRLLDEVRETSDHLVSTLEDATTMHFDRRLDPDTVAALRFAPRRNGVCFEDDGRIRRQLLRGVRELTPESAALLDAIVEPPAFETAAAA